MSLDQLFVKSKNLGKLSQAWWFELQKEMSAKGVTTTVKAAGEQAASLIAPAALVANIANASNVDFNGKLRVLVLGRDAMFRLDEGRWVTYAQDFIGGIEHFELLRITAENGKTSIADVVEGLGRPAATVVSPDEVRTGSCGQIDFAVWTHPAVEIEDDESNELALFAAEISAQGIPVYACHFNEVDHISQCVIVGASGWTFSLAKSGERNHPFVNRYAVGSSGIGVRGGWGAMMSKFERSAEDAISVTAEDVKVVRTALAMLRIEGGGYAKWTLGDTLPSLAGGAVRMLGLLGDMAVDTTYGRVHHLDDEGKVLLLIGHSWKDFMDQRPDNLAGLLVWASRLYINFAFEFPPGDKDRDEYISALRSASEFGVTEATIGLARCLENTKLPDKLAEADLLFRSCSDKSPAAAYYVAHTLVNEDLQKAANLLERAADKGYAHAVCDLGRLILDDPNNQDACFFFLEKAASMGDTTAMFEVAKRDIGLRQNDKAKRVLKPGVELADLSCANMYLTIVTHQLQSGEGDRTKIKREQSWVREQIKRITKMLKLEGPSG